MGTETTRPATAPGTPAAPGMPSPESLAMNDLVYGMFRAQMVFAIAELGVADQLAKGPMTVEDLANNTGANADALRRAMRALLSIGVFGQNAEGRYELNPLSEVLRSDAPRSARPMARFYGSAPVWTAWGNLAHSLRTGEDAFGYVHGQHHFQYMASHPEDAALFNEFMSSLPLFAGALLYDFGNASMLIDVGGGQANGMIPVLRANPHLRGVVFELPEVAVGARAAIASAGLADRCDVVEGSFFDSVPAGGDVYLLSNIIHDWDDLHCAQILRNVRAAMGPASKLLVVEGIVPPGNAPHPMKMIDIQMLVMLGGLQRTEAEFRHLLSVNGFALEQVVAAGMANLIVAATS